MAKKTKSQKNASKKKSSAKKASASASPKILVTKGGLTPAALVVETLAMMEDDLRINKKQAADFMESLVAVVEQQLGEGLPVNIAHLVKIQPRLHTKGEREVFKVFGDPESGKTTKKYPAKVTLAVKKGSRIGTKKAAEILPGVSKMQKLVDSQAAAKRKKK